jgi:hypothetical protein
MAAAVPWVIPHLRNPVAVRRRWLKKAAADVQEAVDRGEVRGRTSERKVRGVGGSCR